jgi:hypothetical protein
MVLVFNLLGEFQLASGRSTYRQPTTLRAQVFLCGLCSVGRSPLGPASVRLLGPPQTRTSLLENVLAYGLATSPKLHPEPAI